MDRYLPPLLADLVRQLAELPGFGPKSALRVAMTLLKWSEPQTKHLGESILALHDTLKICSRCGGLTDQDPCKICTDPERTDAILCIVSDWDSMLTLEKVGLFNGRYLVMNSLFPPDMQNDNPDLDHLAQRLRENTIQEILLALGATIEAENRSHFILSFVRHHFPHIRITRLAQGIPLGAEIKFMDHETLRQSLQYRQEIE